VLVVPDGKVPVDAAGTFVKELGAVNEVLFPNGHRDFLAAETGDFGLFCLFHPHHSSFLPAKTWGRRIGGPLRYVEG
jgi:hypothetical protein